MSNATCCCPRRTNPLAANQTEFLSSSRFAPILELQTFSKNTTLHPTKLILYFFNKKENSRYCPFQSFLIQILSTSKKMSINFSKIFPGFVGRFFRLPEIRLGFVHLEHPARCMMQFDVHNNLLVLKYGSTAKKLVS